jgi:hypothetical protein
LYSAIFSSVNCPFLMSCSSVDSISNVKVSLEATIPRLSYAISQHNSWGNKCRISMLVWLFRLKAFATTFALPGWYQISKSLSLKL